MTPQFADKSFHTKHGLLELRLMVEELCCDLCRFEHSGDAGSHPEQVQIRREVPLGPGRGFADILIRPATGESYFVEVKIGYSDEEALASLRRKFGPPLQAPLDAIKNVVVVLDRGGRAGFDGLSQEIAKAVKSGFQVQIWDEAMFCQKVQHHLGVEILELTPEVLLDVRTAVDHAKAIHAFGPEIAEIPHLAALRSQLLWNFSSWKLRHLRESKGVAIREILEPGGYRDVVVLLADLCSFSSYVRDTPDHEIVRASLTSFYSKARYEIINNGGMLYQFVGDEVIGLFGIPDREGNYIDAAYETAKTLCAVGKSVAEEWQRQIDRMQAKAGIHVGMALGEVQYMPLRPYSRTHCGFIADTINMAARLMGEGGESDIVITNGLHARLGDAARSEFQSVEPVDAKNVGRIRAWKTHVTH